jgi:single-stranded-DNA-specific exonuclease
MKKSQKHPKTQRSPRLGGETRWLEPEEITVPEELRQAIGGHPLVARTLARRGITDPEAAGAFLDPDAYTPSPPGDLPGLTQAADLLDAAIQAGESILVWGDFDVDGQTATTLLVEALRDLGARVSYHIPVRATEGHGIKVEVLERIINGEWSGLEEAANPDVLLTCDTGIAAHQAVDYATSRGIKVVITDHHDLPPELPQADAVLNSNLVPEGHPLGTLPGVGVAYKLIEELYQRRGREAETDQYLDLVALGIVADVAEQVGDTRYLLQRGMKVLRHTQRLGLQTLMKRAEIVPSQINTETIGFSIGPRLNALGRLDDANPIVEFLTTSNPGRAEIIATNLEGLNHQRKLLTKQITEGAHKQIERDPSLLDYAALVLAHPNWAPGVIGIVASRLVDHFHKPTVLLSTPEDDAKGELARGSARSIEGVPISEAIAAQAEMLEGFGGHPMAAGLSLKPSRIADFRRGLSRTIRTMTGEELPQATLQLDAFVTLEEISFNLIDEIERLAPFGAGNPALVLATPNLKIASQTVIGRAREHLRLVVEDQTGETLEVLWWYGADETLPQGNFDLAYRVRTNTFRGERRIQAEWVDYDPIKEPTAEVAPEAPQVEVVDYRGEKHPLPLLENLQAEESIILFTEGDAKSALRGRDRNELERGETLALWTTPPSPGVFAAAMETVSPEKVYLFGIDPDLDEPEPFLTRLLGLVKYALRAKEGRARLSELAAAMAHRQFTVQLGLAWLEQKGYIRAEQRGEGDELELQAGGEPGHALEDVGMGLRAALEETAAYRAYFRRADAGVLLQSAGMESRPTH